MWSLWGQGPRVWRSMGMGSVQGVCGGLGDWGLGGVVCSFTAVLANLCDTVGVLLELEVPFDRPVAKTFLILYVCEF